MGIIANVYRQIDSAHPNGTTKMVDCTNNGWSSNFNTVCVVNAEGPFDPSPSCPAVILVRHRTMNRIHAVLQQHDREGKWTMMGGNFLHSSDGRFCKLARSLLDGDDPFTGAIPIHDRIE